MRRSLLVAASAIAVAFVSTPASAVVLGFDNVALGSNPTVFTLPGATFSFTYDAAAAASFNPDTYSVQTTGTGAVTAVFGEPSEFFTSANIAVDASTFPSFASIPTLSPIPFSLTPGDLGLRYGSDGNFFYGFARTNGDGTLDFAFESQPNTTIIAGSPITGPLAVTPSVPEPATWAMMLLGFGAVGLMLRRRKQFAREHAIAA